MNLDELNEHLAKTVQQTTTDPLKHLITCDNLSSFNIAPLETRQIYGALNGLKTRTATGPDGLSAWLLKNLASEITDNITFIINQSILQGVFPSEWKKANVAAIYKNKGKKTDACNYRPISVLPILARVMEKQVAKQLTQHCNGNQIIPNEQYGFRAKSSCELALLSGLDSWMAELDSGEVVGALLIDLSKAFDTVPHQKLLGALSEIGCAQLTLQWFHSYLSNRIQRVILGSSETEWKTISRGVPQGSGLSPLFFNIYVRDLPNQSSSKTIQFADDITHSEANRSESIVIERLQKSFQSTKSFCKDHELIINTEKTQFIIFKMPTRKLTEDLSIKLDECTILPSDTVKLLGVTLDRHLTFGQHIQTIVKKSNSIMGILQRAAPKLPRKMLLMAYTALIRSHLEYASATFASAAKTHLTKLDIIQKIASRIICRAPRNAHSAPLLNVLHLESLEKRRVEHILKIVDSIIRDDIHPGLKNMFRLNANDQQIENDQTARIGIGRRRFSIFATKKTRENEQDISPTLRD